MNSWLAKILNNKLLVLFIVVVIIVGFLKIVGFGLFFKTDAHGIRGGVIDEEGGE